MGQPNCDAKRTERRAIGVEGAFFNTLLPRPRMPVDNASSWAANSLLLGRPVVVLLFRATLCSDHHSYFCPTVWQRSAPETLWVSVSSPVKYWACITEEGFWNTLTAGHSGAWKRSP